MKKSRQWKTALVLLTGISFVLSNPLMAGQPMVERGVRNTKLRIHDVSLNSVGTLTGFIIDPQGKPEVASQVVIHRGKRRIAVVTTDVRGQFEVKGVNGGVYQFCSPKGSSLYRVWKYGSAPPKAVKHVIVVSNSEVVRSQTPLGLLGLGDRGTLTSVGLGLGIAAAIAIPVAIHNADNGDSSL